jgi:hypothetical protein
MSTLAVNTITNAAGGNTAQINGMTPTADSLQGFRNRLINSDMRIDQRNAGASVTPGAETTVYSVDRWNTYSSQGSKFSMQRNAGSVTPPAGFTNYLGCTSLSAYSVTSSDYFPITQGIEGFNTADLNWGTAGAQSVTLSFWVRSSLTGTFGGVLQNVDNSRSYPFVYTVSAANTWEQKSVIIAGDTSGTWNTGNDRGIAVRFSLGAGSSRSGTAGAWAGSDLRSATGAVSVVATSGATFYITGVQLEAGSVATPFERRPYGTELMLCQRYFESSAFPAATFSTPTTTSLPVFALNTDRASGVKFTVPKRGAPTVVIYSRNNNAGKVSLTASGADASGTASAQSISEYGWNNTAIGSSQTVGAGVEVGYTASAEL